MLPPKRKTGYLLLLGAWDLLQVRRVFYLEWGAPPLQGENLFALYFSSQVIRIRQNYSPSSLQSGGSQIS